MSRNNQQAGLASPICEIARLRWISFSEACAVLNQGYRAAKPFALVTRGAAGRQRSGVAAQSFAPGR